MLCSSQYASLSYDVTASSGFVQEGGTCLIVDGSVYTRNRAFRLYLSSKAGKSSILSPTGTNLLRCANCMSRHRSV